MYQLIGAPVSLYTGKVRCYLQFKGITFKEILSTPQVYKELIIPRAGVRYIPVLVTPDDQVIQDSTDIIDHLERAFPQRSVYPEGSRQKLVALLLEVYGDEWLVNPAMLYRWAIDENREFAIQEFGRTRLPGASDEEQYAAGLEASGPFAGALPRLGVTDHSRPAIEHSYLALLDELNVHFSSYDYLLGGKPCIGDYGLIGPLYAHLYRDPASGRLMRDHAPHVASWVERMISPDAHHNKGDYLADDQIPDTLLPIIARMFDEQVPVLLETARLLEQWTQANPGSNEIPRAIGTLHYRLGDMEDERLAFPYNLWMWQRAHDFYNGLGADDRKAVDTVLNNEQAQALSTPLTARVQRRGNRLER
ncbi:glutathione S-transferase [Pseudomonas sp. FME51]|uniref:glutathione S-transferase n=1 Tax=Pseudomonas sp. FME51 TaxID=2742609 RepID=UPI001865A5B9|nr:glutathione S-transferase [Pseudomonas sp. FME51]